MWCCELCSVHLLFPTCFKANGEQLRPHSYLKIVFSSETSGAVLLSYSRHNTKTISLPGLMSLKWYKSRLSPEIWEKGKLNLPLSKKINAQAIVAVITLIKIIYFKLIIYEKTPRKPRTEKWKNTQTFFVSQLRRFSEQLHISLVSLTQTTWSKGQETDRWGLTTHVSLYASDFKSSCEDDVSYGSQIRVSTTTLLPKWRILWQ